jgi:hypothetical protein
MANIVTFRPRPWFADQLETALTADPDTSKTDLIHDWVEERNKLKVEVVQLRKDNEAFRSVAQQVEQRASEPSEASPPKPKPPTQKAQGNERMVQCLIWDDPVPASQCSKCMADKAVPHCPKIKGGSK